jgi:hypothetical protein
MHTRKIIAQIAISFSSHSPRLSCGPLNRSLSNTSTHTIEVRCEPPCVFITQENALFSMLHLAVKTARALYLARSKLGAAARAIRIVCVPLFKIIPFANVKGAETSAAAYVDERRSAESECAAIHIRPFSKKCRVGCLPARCLSEFLSLLYMLLSARTKLCDKVKIFYRILSI